MSGDTYYTVLGIPESATQDEIKRAYRDLIRQVHPDHVPNATPYWKRAAEEKSKELNEAYHVLVEPDRRLLYDERLATYRQRFAPAPSSWQPDVDVTPPPSSNIRPPNPHRGRRKGKRKKRYDWQPLLHWAGRYPFLAGCLVVLMLLPVVGLLFGLRQHRAAMAAGNTSAADSFYSAFPCLDPHDNVSPIDGKPCRKSDSATTTADVPDPKPPVKLTAPKWFYVTSNGVHSLGGVPDDDTCTRIRARNSAACEASLKFCPLGVWSRSCVSYSKWKKNNVDPPRVEKLIPVWPSP
ncbi:MAG: J domain-containing protein [Rhodomicrobium sp.]